MGLLVIADPIMGGGGVRPTIAASARPRAGKRARCPRLAPSWRGTADYPLPGAVGSLPGPCSSGSARTARDPALQEFDPRLLHGDTSGVVVIMICGGLVRKEEWVRAATLFEACAIP